MKAIIFLVTISISVSAFAQQHAVRGAVFGSKPNPAATIAASNLETYMNQKVRISTTISGKVIKVTKTQGGWFEIDGGNGKIIKAHFRDYKVTIPEDLKGKYIIAEGIAQKQFMANDMQHMAGDNATGKKAHGFKANAKQSLTFEVSGLRVAH